MAGSEKTSNPTSSLRPKARPDKSEDNYLSGLDVEMDADMSQLLYNDPIARLGYRDVDIKYLNTVTPSNNYNALYDREKNRIVYDSTTGSSEDVIAHEARHAGTQKVYDLYMKDPNKFKDMFGTEAVRIIKNQPHADESLVEYYDDPDATWIRPVGEGEAVETNFSDTIQFQRIRDLTKMRRSGEGKWRSSDQSYNEWNPSSRENLGPKDKLSDNDWIEWYPEDYQKGQEGISAAALYLLKEDGEPPQVKKLNPNAIDNYKDPSPDPSLWEKVVDTVKDTLSPDEDNRQDLEGLPKEFNKGGSVTSNDTSPTEDNLQKVAGTGSLAPTAYISGEVRDVNEDTFNPLGDSTDMWKQAGEYFMGAGRNANIKPDDGIITAGAKRANDYYTGMSMAALTGAEAVYQSAASVLTNLVLPGMDDSQEKRLQRDVFGMPDASLGLANIGRIDALGEAAGDLAKGLQVKGNNVLDNLSTNTLGSNLGQALGPKVPEAFRITKFSKIGESPNSTSKLPAFVDSLTIPEKGMKGSNVIKSLEKHPDIKLSSINLDSIDKSKMYSRADLKEVFEGNQLVTDIQDTGKFSADQRQLNIGYVGKETGYNSVAINIDSGNLPEYKVKGQVHFDKNTAAHVRFSEVSSSYLPVQDSQFDEFNKALGLGPGKPRVKMIVNDEVQSDALRQGTFKTLNDAGKEKVISKEFDTKTNGRLSRNLSESHYYTESLANRPPSTSPLSVPEWESVRNGTLDGAKDKVRVYKEAMEDMRRSGVDSNSLDLKEFDQAGSKLFEKVTSDISKGKAVNENDLIHITELRSRKSPEDINLDDYLETIDNVVEEIDQGWKPSILRTGEDEFKSTYDQLPNIGTARISSKQANEMRAIEDYKGDLARELMVIHNKPDYKKHTLVTDYAESRSNFSNAIQESLAKVDEKGLLTNYSTDPKWVDDALRDFNILNNSSKSPVLDQKFSNSPLSKVRDIQDESISVMIQKASEKGIDYIVLPKVNAMYKARPEVNIEKDNMLNRLYDFDESLNGFQKTYPSIKIHKNVKAPYLVNATKSKEMLDKEGIDLGGKNVSVGGMDFNLRGEDVDIIDLSDFKKEFEGKSFRSFAKGGLVSKKNEVKTIDEQMNKLIQSGGVANYG